jgi:hypothetical protein
MAATEKTRPLKVFNGARRISEEKTRNVFRVYKTNISHTMNCAYTYYLCLPVSPHTT